MASKTKDFYKRAHILLILLIFVTFTIIFYIFQLPQKTGSSVARQNVTTCGTSGSSTSSIACTVTAPGNDRTLIATIATSKANSAPNTTGFTTARNQHSSVVNNGFLYIIGGTNGTTYYNDIQRCPINADGTVGSCITPQANVFTNPRGGHASVVYNGYLYIIGGWNGATYYNDVIRCVINADNSIGTCTQQLSAFTTARRAFGSVLYNGYIYIVGGVISSAGTTCNPVSSTSCNDINRCRINADGTVTCTQQTNAFTGARWGLDSTLLDNYIYIVGGDTGAVQNDIQRCAINGDFTVAACTQQTNAFTTPRRSHNTVIYNNYIYILAGRDGVNSLNDIQLCPVNADKSIGTCVQHLNAFSSPRNVPTTVIYSNYMYVVGGWDNTNNFSDIQNVQIGGNRVSSITQSGATWTKAVEANSLSQPTVEIWYTTSLSSASTSITINLAPNAWGSAVIAEYSGVLTSGKLDKTASTVGSSTSASTGTTTTTSQSNQLWVGAMSVSQGNYTFSSPTNSFTELNESSSGGSTASDVNVAYLERIVTSTGTASAGSTLSTTDTWSGVIATFNATGAPTQIAFTNSPPTLQAGVCSTAITFETRDSSGAPVYATNGVVIQIISLLGSSNATFYTTSDCSGSNVSSFTFNGTEASKTFYMKDTYASAAHSLTATKISGSDTLTDGTLSYTVTAGSISKLAIRMPGQDAGYGSGQYIGSPSNQTAGISFTITAITARDVYDNVATGYTGAKTITYSGPGNAPNGTAPSYTTSVTFSNGVSTTILTTTLYKAETGVVITATEGGLYGQATPTFAVNVGAQADYAMVLSGSTVYVNSCADNTLDITSRDAYQNVRTADASTVLMTSSVTGMLFYPNSSCDTSQNSFSLNSGTVRVYWKPLKSNASATITATKSGDTPTGTTSAITIYPGPISTLVIKLPGQSFVSGTGITGSVSFPGLRTPNATAGTSFDVVVYAVDEFNNLVDSGVNNYTGQKTLSWAGSTAGNAPSGTAPSYPITSVTFSNGTSPTLTASYYLASSGRNIRADDTIAPINGTVSTSFTVQSNSADNYSVTAPTPQVAGVAFNVTATARDAYNNALGSLYSPPSGTYSWSTTSENAPDNTAPSLGTILANDFTNGTLSKTVTLYKTSSTATFTISEPSPSGVSGTSNTITINPGKISASSTDSLILGLAYSAPNSPLTVQVHLKDTWRNPVPNVNKSYITIYGTGSPTIVQPLNNTDSSGIAQGTITWTNTGVYTVTVGINTAELVQNDGATLDADGLLDAVKSVTVSNTLIPSSILRGGTIINGGTTIR